MKRTQKIQICLLGVTALTFSKAFFSLINDPEGPNLLIVVVLGLIIFVPSFVFYKRTVTLGAIQKFVGALLIQVVLFSLFHFFLT